MSDLDRLIAMVEAGDERAPGFAGRVFGDTLQTGDAVDVLVNGSLDAALRLHEALLPGWHWKADDGQGQECPFFHVFKFGGTRQDIGEGESEIPARAWLLAILRALKAKGEA